MATSLKQIQVQKQKLAPKQVLQARLLQLNTVNLEQTIIKELEQNPLLEQVETDIPIESEKEEAVNDIDVSSEDMYSDETAYYFQQEKKEMPLPDRNTLIENVIEQLRDTDLKDFEQELAEEILWNTDERGYLDTELILIADRLEMDEEDLEPILHVVQRLKPKGIASRDLNECLKIQLEDELGSISYKIVDEFFHDFIHKRYEKIQSKIKCSKNQLHEAVEHISHLNPRPGEGYSDKFQTVIPDVIVKEDGDDWLITTNDAGLPELRINRKYEKEIQKKNYDFKAKRFIKEKLDSANWFIEAIKQRRDTMVKVMHSIISFQPEWFSGDMSFLNPLKLQDVADQIHMDISTISRSTRGKFADTPYGIFELKYFFTDAIKLNNGQIIGTFVIKQVLKKIIDNEDKHSPLSDDALVKELANRGYLLARRTIAKYRDQLGLSVARLRKEI
tara:strand:+ start:26831 stop:28171 length:1341 start_codon:yes stop_codon:yes gene_type:complete